ncbi:E3 binding domain-containing protein [Salinicola halophilus]|uniref:E3 binding domain-containing protein n=1 Tax=Salinicola halophilus TaxID=184065 RepID=UPI0013A651F8|nr:E3 binding domain-containing protein [Salinicola halophilus]
MGSDRVGTIEENDGSDAGGGESHGRERGGRVHACPAVRKRARLLGLSLAAIPGRGRKGRITPADVERHVAIRSAEHSARSDG